jgi:hypothetical protein
MTVQAPANPAIANADVQARFGGEVRDGWVYGLVVLGQTADGYAVGGRLYLQNASDGAYTARQLAAHANMLLCPGVPLHPSQVRELDGSIVEAPERPTANDNNPEPLIKVHQFELRGTASIPRREWLYGCHLVRKYVSAVFAPGGVGKTSLAVVDALAMVTGKDLVGHSPETPLRVWLVNTEDPAEEIERKLEATAAQYGVTESDIGGRLYYSSGRDSDFVIAVEDKNRTTIVQPVVDAVLDHARRHDIDVLLVDPFVSTHAVHENDNAAIQQVAAMWVGIADKLGCAIDLSHHVTKGGNEVTEDSGRGAGALKDKARAVRVLNRMTPIEAEKWGVPREDARSFFRVDLAKANLTKSGGSSEWYQFVEVPMGNGDGPYRPQDFTGVVARWTPPSPETTAAMKAEREAEERQAVVGDVPAETLAGLKVRLAHGGYKADPQGKPWAGEVVAELLALDVTSDRDRIKRMLAAWVDGGELEVVDEHDEGLRKKRKFLRPRACAT